MEKWQSTQLLFVLGVTFVYTCPTTDQCFHKASGIVRKITSWHRRTVLRAQSSPFFQSLELPPFFRAQSPPPFSRAHSSPFFRAQSSPFFSELRAPLFQSSKPSPPPPPPLFFSLQSSPFFRVQSSPFFQSSELRITWNHRNDQHRWSLSDVTSFFLSVCLFVFNARVCLSVGVGFLTLLCLYCLLGGRMNSRSMGGNWVCFKPCFVWQRGCLNISIYIYIFIYILHWNPLQMEINREEFCWRQTDYNSPLINLCCLVVVFKQFCCC